MKRPALSIAAACLGLSVAALIASVDPAMAEAAEAASHDLPAVTVDAPKERPKPAPARARPAAQATRVRKVEVKPRKRPSNTTARRSSPPVTAVAAPQATPGRPIDAQSPKGPGVGFSATRTTTATKTDTPILETPQSISVVTRDQIRDIGAQTITEAISYSAGVTPSPFGFDSRYDTFLIRGFQTDTVGLYRDGLREANAPFARFRNEPNDVDRIEILRGPPSVLYGSSNPGGLVNLVSRTPEERNFGDIDVDFGSFNEKQTHFDVNTAVGTGGNVWLRVDGLFRDSDTQVLGAPNNRANISPSLKIDFDNQTTLTLLGTYAGNRTSMWPYSVHTANNFVYNARAGDPSFDTLNQNQYSFGYQFEHKFNDVFTAHQNFRIGHVGFDGGFVDQNNPVVPPETLVTRYDGRFTDDLRSTEVDTNLQAKFATGPVKHTALVGLDYFHQAYNELFQLGGPAPTLDLLNPISQAGFGTGPLVPPTTPVAKTFQQLDQLGVYGQEQAVLGGLHLTLGGRHDQATTNTDNLLANSTVSADDARWTGRAGALYLFDNGLAPYTSYSTSFLPQPGTTAESTPFKPTTGKQIEAGAKYAPKGWNSTFTASYFHINQDNVTTTDPANPMFSIQTGEVRSQGLELEAVIGLARGLNGIASYTNTDARTVQSNNIDLGKVPVAVPRNQAGAFLDYTIPYGQLKGFGGGAGVRYFGGNWADLGNTLRNDAITAVDLQGHYDTGKLRFQVSVRNLADQRVSVCNSGNCTFSEARIVLGSLTARW